MRSWALAAAVSVTMGVACYAVPSATDSGDPAAEPGTALAATTSDDGLPCDVAELLTTRCATCHADPPSGGAPMPMVRYADLVAPSKSQSGESVAKVALARMRDGARPMPPTTQLPDGEIAPFAAWVEAGAPRTACSTTASVRARDASGPECRLSSDCPGALVCRGGVCDVECVADKDCAVGSSCQETRCVSSGEAAVASDAGAPITYGGFGEAESWTAYAVPGIASAAFNGAVFDGRCVYFPPDNTSGLALRLDTTTGFDKARSWATLDLTAIAADAKGYRGAAFDGRHVYLVPLASAPVARFDTRGAFLDPASWSFFRPATVNASVGFTGATFDGRYLYLVPAWDGPEVTFRYDTEAPFTSSSSWSSFSIATVNASARSFAGAVFDGRHVYYVPSSRAGAPQGVLARYDTEGLFTEKASWSTVDLAVLEPKASGFRTGAFDGRYLYLVPGWTAPIPSWASSTFARYDTQAPFGEAKSWTFFDTTTVAPGASGFNGAAFDGRHLILEPAYDGSSYHGLSLRYDTRAGVANQAAWTWFDTTSVHASLKNLRGAAFDGTYVYFAPKSGVALRYAARTPAGPVGVGGSFY